MASAAPQPASITNFIAMKLSQDNYTEWKPLISTFLGSRSLLGYVDGTIPCPSADDFFYSNWCRTDEDIRSWLFGTLTEPLLGEVKDLPSAKAVWDALHARDVLGSRPGPINIRQALSRHKLGTQGMDEYLRLIELLADQLKFVPASPLSNDDLVAYALQGLPQEYEAFATSISNGHDTITFEELRTKLIHQDIDQTPYSSPKLHNRRRRLHGEASSSVSEYDVPLSFRGPASRQSLQENQLTETAYQEDPRQTPSSEILETTATAQQQRLIPQGQQDEDVSEASFVSKYDVFLSFRGPDSRSCLVDVLYREMIAAGISVFKDDRELEDGDRIKKILPCINNSKICIPIFSEGFAASDWCLREVERMVVLGKEIRPIFYKVIPDDVKLRTNLFEKDLQGHVEKHGREQVQKWENALKVAGSYIGREVTKSTPLAEFSMSFVRPLASRLAVKRKQVTETLVNRYDEEEELMKLLDTDDAQLVIGVHGMGGAGKTTLAKVVFNQRSDRFDCCCFLENIQESVTQPGGLEGLQKQLVGDLDPKSKHYPETEREKMLKQKFGSKKVLLVLDDVNEKKQVGMIIGKLDWYGSGSRIIITTRNTSVFPEGTRALELQEMNDGQALQLFTRHAFGKGSLPPSNWKSLSDEVVGLTGRLPLALEIIGSLLYEYNEEKIWKEMIEKLKKHPNRDILGKLRISYDALDDQEKQIFLDISCFLLNEEPSRAEYMWEDCGLSPTSGIRVLVSRSLLKVTKKDEAIDFLFDDPYGKRERDVFWMHDLVRDLGRAIVQEKYPEEPVKWSIWSQREAEELLKIKKGKEDVKGLILQNTVLPGEPYINNIKLTNEHFSRFSNLRFLKLTDTRFVGDFELIVLPELRWFSWFSSYSWNSWLPNLSLEKLVVLELSSGDVLDDWHGWSLIQRANNLKVLDLTGSFLFQRTPDLSNNKALEILILRRCFDLIEMHSSIIELKRLKHLDLTNCYTLESIPDLSNNEALEILILYGCSSLVEIHSSIGKLKRLKNLDLRNCTKLRRIPDLSNNEDLERLDAMYCYDLVEIDSSIGKLKHLKHLNVGGFPEEIGSRGNLKEILKKGDVNSTFHVPESIGELHSLLTVQLCKITITEIPRSIDKVVNLTRLDLGSCKGMEVLPDTIGDLKSLVELNLAFTGLSALPHSVGRLAKLQSLQLQSTKITELPDTIGDLKSLCELYLNNTMIEELPNTFGHLVSLKELSMQHMTNLKELPDSFGNLKSLEVLDLEGSGLTNTKVSVLPESIGQLDKLEKLCLDSTMIEELPNTFGHLASLKELSMQHMTNLKELPDSFGNLKSLEVLNLEGSSQLTVLPEWVGDLKSLRRFNLNNTKVSVLPKSIGQLDKLQSLSLRATKVEELPDSLGALKSLKRLDLSGCSKLRILPESVGDLSNLEALNMRCCNSLTEFPPEIGNLSSLTDLKLTASHVAKIPPTINHLTSLKELSIRFHQDGVHGADPASLTTSLDLGALTLLEELDLDCSGFKGIQQLPSALTGLTLSRFTTKIKLQDHSNLENLKRIGFRDCSLEDVHALESLREVRSLRSVSFYNCREEVVESWRELRKAEGMRRFLLFEEYELDKDDLANPDWDDSSFSDVELRISCAFDVDPWGPPPVTPSNSSGSSDSELLSSGESDGPLDLELRLRPPGTLPGDGPSYLSSLT